MIRYDQTGQWPSSRRCDRIFAYIGYTTPDSTYYIGAINGNYGTSEQMPNYTHRCSQRHDYRFGWSAICDCVHNDVDVSNWAKDKTCPYGFGKGKHYYPNDNYTVQNAQGYAKTGRLPVYGYVTRYNTKYYNYITARVSKA